MCYSFDSNGWNGLIQNLRLFLSRYIPLSSCDILESGQLFSKFLKIYVFTSTPWLVYSFVSCTFSLQLSGSSWACAERHWLSAGLRHGQVASLGAVKHVWVAPHNDIKKGSSWIYSFFFYYFGKGVCGLFLVVETALQFYALFLRRMVRLYYLYQV